MLLANKHSNKYVHYWCTVEKASATSRLKSPQRYSVGAKKIHLMSVHISLAQKETHTDQEDLVGAFTECRVIRTVHRSLTSEL